MRLSAVLAIVVLAVVPAAAGAKSPPVAGPKGAADCPRTSSYLAEEIGAYRGKAMTPRKLGELPSGTPYMAVYRQIGGCDAPMTMVEYRNPRRR